MHNSIQQVLNRPLNELVQQILGIKDKLIHNQKRFKSLAELIPVRLWTEANNARMHGHRDRLILRQLAEPNVHIRVTNK